MGMTLFCGSVPTHIEKWIKEQYGPVAPEHTIITYNNGRPAKEVEVGTDGILTQTLVENAGDYTAIQTVEIGSDVTSIQYRAFHGCSGLTSVTIPSSVTSIGSDAFSYCSSLTSVTLSEGLTSIGAEAFSGCSSLTSVTIPSSVTSIGAWAFRVCSGLTSIMIPSSVTSIAWYAFEGCTSLNDITFDKTMEEVSNMTNYSWSLSKGKVIKCTDGDITVS